MANSSNMTAIKRSSVRGGAVTLATQGATLLVQVTSVLILSRLLPPAAFGLMSMVAAVTSLATPFQNLGLSAAAVQKTDLTRDQQSNLFWLNLAAGAALTIFVASAAPIVVWFYNEPLLSSITIALAFTFLIASAGSQHRAMLIRNMSFGRLAIASITSAVVGLIISIALALEGWSYWSLVVGNLGRSTTNSAVLFALSPFTPGRFTRNIGTRDLLNFGANITGFELVNYFHRNLDNILVGHVWGSVSLGLYSRAYQLVTLPISAIRSPITAVAYPAMSRIREQKSEFRAYYMRITFLLAFVSMPCTAFALVAARDLIALALGPDWSAITPIFSFLALPQAG